MKTQVTLQNSGELYLTSEETFLRSIPTKLKVGRLNTDELRLLVYYVTKASPYELAIESGYFEGTLKEWLESLQANLTFKTVVETYADLESLTDLINGHMVYVKTLGKLYIYDGASFQDEDKGISISGDSAYEVAVKNGFVGTEQEWLASLKGVQGDKGVEGDRGSTGPFGVPGKSAYEVATKNGYTGTEEEWLVSLKAEATPHPKVPFVTMPDELIADTLTNEELVAYTKSLITTLQGMRDSLITYGIMKPEN